MATDIGQRRQHRPAPLAPTQASQYADTGGGEAGGGGGGGRAQFLSSLRTARPAQIQSQTPMAGMSAAFELQQQANFLALQQQILFQQQQLILAQQQQQVEAEAAMRAMRLSSSVIASDHTQQWRGPHQHQLAFDGRTSSLVTPEDEEAVRDNPLAASALARRKRQSFSMEPAPPANHSQTTTTTLASRRTDHDSDPSLALHHSVHHRRSSSTVSSFEKRDLRSPTQSWSTGTDTPAVVLSAPGEAYPSPTSSMDDGVIIASTASASPLRRGHTRRISVEVRSPHSNASSVSSVVEEGRIAPWLEGIKEATSPLLDGTGRRPSQASQLTAALSGRRQRPSSMNGPPAGMVPIDTLRAPMRSVSDSIASPSALSPFATTFQPLPATPRTPSPTELTTPMNGRFHQPLQHHQQQQQQPPQQQTRHSPPLGGNSQRANQPGMATAIRQPRGPESDLSVANFATRLRKRAIATLLRTGPDVRTATPLAVLGFQDA